MEALATIAILILLLVAPLVLWLKARGQTRAAKKQVAVLESQLANRQRQLREALEGLKKLEPFKECADAKVKADSIVKEAQLSAIDIRKKVQHRLNNSKQEGDAIKKRALEEFQRAVDEVKRAEKEAQKIIWTARKRATDIAGDALEARGKADEYRRTAEAMRNVVEGYRDEYLKPNHCAIDDLAEEFSHKDAGQELKQVRREIRSRIKNGQAAECDYVQVSRREIAIHFVVDAFNGKVDSILSKAKHDNFGKLQQEIHDAFQLVNHNGSSFRNARIVKDYLELRLTELRWAVATNELKLQEREEQRRIKEAMREEERARREYEKALKETAKEEEMLQKAMEEARRHLNEGTEEQRRQYEAQLADLQSKLEEAEAKNQRALSMAQQTRSGHVYVISNIGSFGEEVFKVGMTRRLEPMDRVKELGDASVPFEFDVHAMIYSVDAPGLENALHRQFDQHRLNKINTRKEFFRLSLSAIKETIEALGAKAHFTMRAEAAQYRESIAMATHTPPIAEQRSDQVDDVVTL